MGMSENMPERIWAIDDAACDCPEIWSDTNDWRGGTPYLKASTVTPVIEGLVDALRNYLLEDEVATGHGYGVGGPIRKEAKAAIAEADKFLGSDFADSNEAKKLMGE